MSQSDEAGRTRIPMRRLAPADAIAGFEEVLVGYSREEAVAEAIRIRELGLLEGSPGCMFGVDLGRLVDTIAGGDFTAALQVVHEGHAWPGILGRHCTRPCEASADRPIGPQSPNLSGLERAAADHGDWSGISFSPGVSTGRRIALLGAGSTGGALAHRLRTLGHAVEMYDQLPFPGGMMRVGYPAFRLPESILDREWMPDRWGVTTHLGVRFDQDLVLRLLEECDAVVVTAGKFKARRAGLPGEGLPGVEHALDFLVRFRTGQEVDCGDEVVVIGGGYTARDASRTCRRLGANVRILYRGEVSDMPVAPQLREQFVRDQEAEGAPYTFSTAVTEFLPDGDGRLRALRTVQVVRQGGELVPVPGTEGEIVADTVMLAIGEETDLSFLPPAVAMDGEGLIVVDEDGATSVEGLYAAGEVAGVARTANAMRSGIRLAEHLHVRLSSAAPA